MLIELITQNHIIRVNLNTSALLDQINVDDQAIFTLFAFKDPCDPLKNPASNLNTSTGGIVRIWINLHF